MAITVKIPLIISVTIEISPPVIFTPPIVSKTFLSKKGLKIGNFFELYPELTDRFYEELEKTK